MRDPDLKERRSLRRFAIIISLVYFNFEKNKVSTARTLDMTNKGLGLITDEDLQPKYPLDIWIYVPDNKEHIHTIGEVIWTCKVEGDKYRVGVCLKDSGFKLMPVVLRTIQSKLP